MALMWLCGTLIPDQKPFSRQAESLIDNTKRPEVPPPPKKTFFPIYISDFLILKKF